MNEEITHQVLQSCLSIGAVEFIVCAGSRNSSFVEILRQEPQLKTYYWPEERSAAFFALGRSKALEKPVAIITTSGTAVAELLPATMEAFYTGVPLILITADRPQTFRGSGAPQSVEQVGIFGHYVQLCLDVTKKTPCCLSDWKMKSPIHLNVCLEEPQKEPKFEGKTFLLSGLKNREQPTQDFSLANEILNKFLMEVKNPLAIVSTLRKPVCESVVNLLNFLEIPVMLEGISGLREDPRLQSMSIQRTDKILETATKAGYPIDGVLRIGGVPTHRIWRDLEYLEDKIKVCSLSEQPFSGLSWSRCIAEVPLDQFLTTYHLTKRFGFHQAKRWLREDAEYQKRLEELFEEESLAEPSMIYELSKNIPPSAHIYLGNSLPIRHWDMAAKRENKNWGIHANRGVNGIDGQISTFLGLSGQNRENWGIFGDLTTLYDMAAFWVLPQLREISVKIVVINNGGGMIFQRLFPYREMLNEHQLSFQFLAKFWNLDYIQLKDLQEFPVEVPLGSSRQFIEIIPDEEATARFWSKYSRLDTHKPVLVEALKR